MNIDWFMVISENFCLLIHEIRHHTYSIQLLLPALCVGVTPGSAQASCSQTMRSPLSFSPDWFFLILSIRCNWWKASTVSLRKWHFPGSKCGFYANFTDSFFFTMVRIGLSLISPRRYLVFVWLGRGTMSNSGPHLVVSRGLFELGI